MPAWVASRSTASGKLSPSVSITKSKMLPFLPEEKSNHAILWSLAKNEGVFSWLNGERPRHSRPAFLSFTRRPTTSETGAPKTFVLVHGAWHGGWCWRRVSDLLEKKGHKVFSPTLTGVGERSHLMSKDIILDTHITDIVNVFKWEDLKDACLVVHSYGGYPGSGALEQIGDRVSSIIWLDAFKPENSERLFDVTSEVSRKGLLDAM